MSNYLKEFNFERPPKKITYFDTEPLSLNSEFTFFHNKTKFRKELTRLQNLFKSYTKSPLMASAIRDTYLKEEYTEKYLIVLFTTSEYIEETNKIIDSHNEMEFNPGCFFLEATSKYILLLTRDMDGLTSGVDMMESILNQILEDYMIQKRYNEYIMICPFQITDCTQD